MNAFLNDILEQPDALNKVIDYYLDEGASRLNEAVSMIKDHQRVVFTSMGSAYFSLIPAYDALSRIHPNVHLIETAALMNSPRFEKTLYLIMSRSGESGEIAQFSGTLRAQKENLIAVTMTPESVLAKNADLVLHDPVPFDGFICTKAYTSMALVGLFLASSFAGTFNAVLIDRLRQMTGWLEKNKLRLLEQVRSIEWLGEEITFISRFEGMGLAMSGALWLAEGARLRGDTTSIDQFRHGPVEQVQEGFNGVWIDLLQDKNAEDYVHFMQEMGARMISIRAGDNLTADIRIPDFGLPAAYRSLALALPVQMIAYQSGVNRGHEPGTMRYVSWVVK